MSNMQTISSMRREALIDKVHSYLLACEQRDLVGASSHLAEGATLTFPGGFTCTSLESMVADANRRYKWVRKHRDHFDVFLDEDNDEVVVSRGTLDGQTLEGKDFAGVRYQDRFVFRNNKIVDQQVWNDLAVAGVVPAAR